MLNRALSRAIVQDGGLLSTGSVVTSSQIAFAIRPICTVYPLSRYHKNSSTVRTYATAQATTSRPTSKKAATKATTKVTASKSSTKTKTKPTSQKRKKTKKTTVAKKKPAKKIKRVVKKAKVVRKKKVLTPVEKLVLQVQKLRAAALLSEAPTARNVNSWSLYVQKHSKRGSSASTQVRELAEDFKNLSIAEKERIDQDVLREKQSNTRAYESWLESHTVAQIADANTARRALNRIANSPVPEGRKNHLTRKVPLIKDDRRVKRPQTAYFLFAQDRRSSGEFSGTSLGEAAKAIGKEWKALSEAETKPYRDQSAVLLEEYAKQYEAAYSRKSRAKTSQS